jgi:hypothetical protein
MLLLQRASFAFFAHSGSVSIPLTRLPPSLIAASRMPPDPEWIVKIGVQLVRGVADNRPELSEVSISPFYRIYAAIVGYQQFDMSRTGQVSISLTCEDI